MSKYHVNPETGRANICKANKRECPLGADVPHFETRNEANSYVEKQAARGNKMFVKFAKKKNMIQPIELDKGALTELEELKEKRPKSFAVFERKMKPGRGNFADSGFIDKEDDLLEVMKEDAEKWTDEKVLDVIYQCKKLRDAKYQRRRPADLKDGLETAYLDSFYMGSQDCPFCSNKINVNTKTVFRDAGHGSYVVGREDVYNSRNVMVKFTDLDVHMLEAHRFEQRTAFSPHFDRLSNLFE